MQIKETAFCKNVKTGKAATADWGAEIGQGKKKLMKNDVSDILNGMLYYKIDNIDDIKCVMGQTVFGEDPRTPQVLSSYAPDLSIVVASVFQRVLLNGEELPDVKFIMFVTKDERKVNGNGEPNVQYQRRYLKFPDKATYKGNPYNLNCIDAIRKKLGCGENGSWIVTDMDFVGDALSLKAVVLDKNENTRFEDKAQRSERLKRIKYMESEKKYKASSYEGEMSPYILYGPPGTGKTHRMQKDYISHFDKENCFVTTFHQSFSYEDFVEGLKPVLDSDTEDIKYVVEKGVFKKACERAVQCAGYATLTECIEDSFENRKAKFKQAINEKKTVLLCIDEINRGNVAAIFGDLISLIEDSKRLGVDINSEMVVTLPHSQEKFAVPANLLIVGTMNTADRSIQLLDSALRRRFKFKELLPDYSVFEPLSDDTEEIKEVRKSAKTILENINSRVRCLLNKDNQIGHSYLMFAKNDKEIFDAIVGKIIPLLEEYFYNDVQKIRFILNELDDVKYPFYKEDKKAKQAFESFVIDSDLEDEDKSFFELNYSINNKTDYKKYLLHLLGESDKDINNNTGADTSTD